MHDSALTTIAALGDDIVGRFLRRAGRASVAGLLGIMEMEDVWMDPAASEAMQILSTSSDRVTGLRTDAREFVSDALYEAVDDGYRLARVLLGTILLRPSYSPSDNDAGENLLGLLASVKLLSVPEIEELLVGAPQDAVEALVSPLVARNTPLRKVLGVTGAIDVVYDLLYDGVKLALSEETLFSLIRTATLP